MNHMPWRSALVLASLLVGSTIGGHPCKPVTAGVPETYRFLYDSEWSATEAETKAAWAAIPISRIVLEHRPCVGSCPWATVTFEKGGTAHYQGTANVRLVGNYTGKIQVKDFARLSYLIEKLGIERLKDQFVPEGGTGSAGLGTVLNVHRVDSKNSKQIWEINKSGPIELWAVQMAIDAVADTIEWDQVENQQSSDVGRATKANNK